IIMGIGLTAIITLNTIFAQLSFWYCLIVSLLNFICVFAMDGLFAFVIHKIPMKHFSPYKKIFLTSAREHTFYEKIKIRKWKDYIMELDSWGNFKKDKIGSTDPQYMLRFLQENCCGEIIHYFCLISGVANLIFLNYHFLNFSLPIIIVNLILNIPPIFIQRYNRPKLLHIYELKQPKATQLAD
ncbi:MAG: hypothetical protein RR086_02080, partial [Clostridia bacterium]